MKTNFTILKNFMSLTAAIIISAAAKADNLAPILSFTNAPTLQSGSALQVGAVYKFTNVASGTDVLVTIFSATGGATVAMLDDNSLTKPEAFSPQIRVPANSNGMVTFKFDFINGGGNPKSIALLAATAMDIDGSSTMHEKDAINMGLGSLVSYLVNTLEISVQQNGTEFLGTNIAGHEYTGVDTSAKQVMFTVSNSSPISSFTYSAGANNQTSGVVTRQKGIYFKGFDYLTFLPVKYRSFDAVANDNVVTLKWITENEINNHHFEVERSFDGNSFKTIGLVLDGYAAGSGSKSYMMKDNSAALMDASVVYYRLKQVDQDGKYTYSSTLLVRMQSISGVKMQVSPNPFVENLNVRFTASEAGTAQVQIITINGQKVQVQQAAIGKGNNSIQVQGISKLNPGIYIAQLVVNGVVTDNQKIIKN